MLALVLGLALLAPPPAVAHEGDAPTHAPTERVTADGTTVERSLVVRGTVRDLVGVLYAVDRWPAVFSDVRAVTARPGGPWALDFRRFGHPHDFNVRRTGRGVMLELASASHGAARLEYALAPVDAEHSELTVRYFMTTPPTLTPEAVVTLLRDKAATDLADFATTAAR